jgi:L-histidine N-alpha-methyltransferase
MNFDNELVIAQSRLSIVNLLPEIGIDDTRNEIVEGLTSDQKYVSSKFFYDQEGSKLFEEITELNEYYPTRTEKSILKEIAPALMESYSDYNIIELGSGDCSKISILLEAMPSNQDNEFTYLPMDVSQSAIYKSAIEIILRYANVKVEGYVVDFTSQFEHIQHNQPVLICFFGSTLGNFSRKDSLSLLKNIGKHMKSGDGFLLGLDMIKSEPILHSAYNDSKGITEAFNKNILNTVNSIIESDFDPGDFDHLAFYNRNQARIQMHLVANKDITIQSPYLERELKILKDESIHTENSHKFAHKNILEISHTTGLQVANIYSDDQQYFSLVHFVKP